MQKRVVRSSEGNVGPLAGLGPLLPAVLCRLPTFAVCFLSLCVHSLPVHPDRDCHLCALWGNRAQCH